MYSLRMHDLGYFREHLEEFEKVAADRGVAIDFDAFRALDRERRERITAVERLKAERNKASGEIARRKKAGEDATTLLAEMKRGRFAIPSGRSLPLATRECRRGPNSVESRAGREGGGVAKPGG